MASVLERARASLDRVRDVLRSTDAPAEGAVAHPRAVDIAELFETQVVTRLVDIASHAMRERGESFYTICSAGHEGNGAVGRATRTSDPALLHYRSASFFLERARATAGAVDGARDLLASLAGSTADPISGGRHKVFGSVPLGILPQTSTIASHLPKAVGLAVAIERAARLDGGSGLRDGGSGLRDGGRGLRGGVQTPYPRDAIVVCSFGDASVNHSTAIGALNAASWVTYQKLPVPVLFVCEDNGLGISVRTPPGWIETRLSALPGIEHVRADGCDPLAILHAAERAADQVRSSRTPVVLHMSCVRLWGHAGSDADTEYREAGEIAEVDARDPLLATAALVVASGTMTSADALALIERHDARVAGLVEETCASPRITTRAHVMAPLARYSADRVKAEARAHGPAPSASERAAAERPQPFGLAVRAGLSELLARYPEMLVFGEDVAQKGGVYGLTAGLWRRFGPKRVFNTLLDEQTILGLALGAGMAGLLPFPEIQYLAYLHNAIDQVRAEAATYPFLSAGQLSAPIVVRVAGMASREGFGGHFHNENSLSSLRDVPGLVLGVPSRGDDAVAMMRTMAALAKVDGRACVIVEPIALFRTRDLHEPGDGCWCFPLPAEGTAIDLDEVGVYEAEGAKAPAVVILTYGPGVLLALRAQRALASSGVAARVVDLRWIVPLPVEAIRAHAVEAGRVVVLDEARVSGSVSEAIAAALLDDPKTRGVGFARVCGADSFVPLGRAAALVLPTEAEVVDAARALVHPRS